MRIEDYQKWLSSQFVDEPEEEEAQHTAAEALVEPEPIVEAIQFAPTPPPPPAAAPAWRPPTPPAAPEVMAESLDTTQPGPAAYIGRPPLQPHSAAPPQPEGATQEPEQEEEAFIAPLLPAEPPTYSPPAPRQPVQRIDTEPVYTQPARVIDESEEVAPPIDRYFRLKRPTLPAGQLPFDEIPPSPAEVAAAEAPAPIDEPEAEREAWVEPTPEPEPASAASDEPSDAEQAMEGAIGGQAEPDALPVEPQVGTFVEEICLAPIQPEPVAEATPAPQIVAASQPFTQAAAEEAGAPAEANPPAAPTAPVRRARHARNVRPTEIAKEMDAKALWGLVPRHIQTLVAMDSDDVTQNSYKRAFRESRIELVQRLLDPSLSLEETARLLNVCPTTVRRYTNRGLLTHQRTSGDQRRFRLSDVLAFLEAQQRARE